MSAPDLVLHQHPFSSYCWKALMALEERGVPCARHEIAGAGDREALAALWPAASMPVLEDRTAGVVVVQSSAIVEHLDRYGDAPPLVPADRDAALQARMWDRISDDLVMTPMTAVVADALRPDDAHDPHGVAAAHEAIARAYGVLDGRLRQTGSWLAGPDLSLADVAAAPALLYADAVHERDRSAHPALEAYLERLFARPSVAAVIDAARPLRHTMFPLPWPDHVA